MDETKLLGEGTELHVDRIAISGTFESVGEAAQIRRREHLGIAVPRADLASDERHADMSVDTNGTMLLKLDPRCADRLDVELAPPLRETRLKLRPPSTVWKSRPVSESAA